MVVWRVFRGGQIGVEDEKRSVGVMPVAAPLLPNDVDDLVAAIKRNRISARDASARYWSEQSDHISN